MFQVGSFVFGVITVMATAPDVFNPKLLHIMKNKDNKGANAAYPGIKQQIHYFETTPLPGCPHCQSADTASVQAGIIPRTVFIASSTPRLKLIPNGPLPGSYFCNACERYFN